MLLSIKFIISEFRYSEYAEFAETVNMLAVLTLKRRHYGRDGVSNHQPHHCLLECLLHKKSMSLAFVSQVTGEFPAQMANNAENVSIWWRYHGENCFLYGTV